MAARPRPLEPRQVTTEDPARFAMFVNLSSLARRFHRFPSTDAKLLAVASRTPSSRFDVVSYLHESHRLAEGLDTTRTPAFEVRDTLVPVAVSGVRLIELFAEARSGGYIGIDLTRY